MIMEALLGQSYRPAYEEAEANLWHQLKRRGRSLNMAPLGGHPYASLDLDKISGR